MQYSEMTVLASFLLSTTVWGMEIASSSFVGQTGDRVVATGIQPDGSVIVAANITGGPLASQSAAPGTVMWLSVDGSRLLAKTAVGGNVNDMSVDDDGNIFVASSVGVVKLDGQTKEIVWTKDLGRVANRIDAGRDGHFAVLYYDKPEEDTATGAGMVFVFSPNGETIGQFNGKDFTIDVCLDSASKTVIYVGFRNAKAWEGKRVFPVQIAYVKARGYDGEEKYTLYDWGTDREAPGFLNKETNNMADTRGYRCDIGDDGLLYCAFECAGGNHIFRWEPRLFEGSWVSSREKKAKGDEYHAFYNSRAEHKTFLARYDPGTGEYLRGQEFCARLSSGRANAVRVKQGAITATDDGSVLVAGTAAASLPVTFAPPNTGEYYGGSFVLKMRPELSQRGWCVRLQPGGITHTVASRRIDDKLVVVAGGSISEKSAEQFFTKNAIQANGVPGCGFLTVLTEN